MNNVPGRIPAFLTSENVGLLRAEDRVFEAMLDGWRAQMLARGVWIERARNTWPATAQHRRW